MAGPSQARGVVENLLNLLRKHKKDTESDKYINGLNQTDLLKVLTDLK